MEYGAFFRFWKYWPIDPFMIKKPKPRFFEFRGFGHYSTSNNSVNQCCIFLKSSFKCASFDVSDSPIKHIFFLYFFGMFFVFLPKKWSFIFEFKKKVRLTRYDHLTKKVNIFEIGSLEVYGKGRGMVPRVYTELRPYMYICTYVPFYLSIYLSIWLLPFYVSIFLSIYISIYLSIYLSRREALVRVQAGVRMHLAKKQHRPRIKALVSIKGLAGQVSIYPCLSIYISIYLCLSIYLSIYLLFSLNTNGS